MRKITFILSLVAAVVLISMLFGSASFAKEHPDKTTKRDWSRALHKPTDEPRYQILNINNLWTWMESNGESNHSPDGDNGTYYPRGTAWLIYKDGIMWGGKCYTDEAMTSGAPYDQIIRVGGSHYDPGVREGHVIGMGATAAPSDPANARIYRIRRDYASMDPEELKRDAAEYNETGVDQVSQAEIDEIYAWYERDWTEWPVDLGAPFIDRNGNGVYDPPPPFSATFTVDSLIAGGYDEPGLAGADPNSPANQVLWTVYNDLDREQCLQLQGSEPVGLELQTTVWGYKRTDPLGNLYFRKIRLINKGGVDVDGSGTLGSFWIDSMYVAQWSDPDLGVAGDDLLGCDTLLSMGYVYNGNANDNEFVKFSLPPPAAGYDFLQGPAVPSPGDRAVFDLKYRDDFKNLGMTSFSWFSAGSPISDPPEGDYVRGTLRWYKMLRGYVPLDGPLDFYPFPTGVEPNRFPYSGDPIKGSGLLDGEGQPWSFAPGDRRLNCSTGPFTLAPGDTQEVVVAVVCGLGADRLSSVAVMKFNDRFAQNTYDALFQVSSPPKSPRVTAVELDGKVILEWGSDMTNVKDIEATVNEPGGFVFEGYNVYQFPTRTASVADAKRITTFDLPTDPTVILDEQFDQASGQILSLPVQYGSNSGILRYFEFDQDYLLDIGKIYNGQEYYLAVTAYSRATVEGYLPAILESAPIVLTVIPKVPFGTEYEVALGDTLPHTHAAGGSDGAAYPIIIDASKLTGHDYEVTFNDLGGGETSWNLDDLTTGERLIEGATNQTGDDDYLFTDGFQLRVVGAPLDFKSFQCVANAAGPIDPPESAAAPWQGFPCPTDVDPDGYPTDGQQVGEGLWLIHTGDNGSRAAYSAFLSRSPRNDDFSRLIPFDWEMRFTERGSYAYKGYEANEVVWVPFELWCIGMNTPADVSDDYRLIPILLEDVGGTINNQFDMSMWGADNEHTVSGGDNDPYTDWVYWMQPIDMAPGEAGYDAYVAALDMANMVAPQAALDLVGDEVLARMVLVNWNGGSAPPFNQDLPETGTIFRLITTKPNTVTDVFKFTTIAPTVTAELQKTSADNVGVFPNPYYAYNPAERNRLARFVTFNNLPPEATVRIFNLAGQLVRKIDKNDNAQFLKWDLLNHDALPVASGMYIAHIEMNMPADGSKVTKVLKLAIIQEQEVLDVY